MIYFIRDFFKAISNCLQAFRILFSRGLWPYVFYPLLLWILIWVLSLYGLFKLADVISAWLSSYFNFEEIPATGHWLSFARDYLLGIFSFLISLTLKILFWFIAGTFIKYLVLIVLSPVFSMLSEKTEEKLTGKKYNFSPLQLTKDIFRGIIISLRNMVSEYFYIFLCFILTLFFPPLIFFTTPFLFFVGWYFVGFTLLDYNCERHQLKAADSLDLIRNHKGYACGIGMVYSLFLALPFIPGSLIGLMFGPSIASIGGTISFLEMKGKGNYPP